MVSSIFPNNFIPMSPYVEKFFAKYGVAFTLVVMYQGIFGGTTMIDPPERLRVVSESLLFRLFTLFAVAFTATRDVEISLIAVIAFVVILNLARTSEERKENKIL